MKLKLESNIGTILKTICGSIFKKDNMEREEDRTGQYIDCLPERVDEVGLITQIKEVWK